MPKRKDVLLIVLVFALAAAMLGVSRLMPKTDLSEKTADVTLAPDAIEYVAAPEPTEAPTAKPAESPAVTEAPAQVVVPAATATPVSTAEPTAEPGQETAMVGLKQPKKAEVIRGHVILTVGSRQHGDPIPMDRDKIITLRQDDGKINKVHITPEKVYMESSTCDNQDCVQQGEVHVDTYQDRILGTYVICLPNNVSVEMIPAE